MARRKNRFASRAALEALLRFGPEVSGLTEMQRAAEGQFTSSVRGARASARGTVQAVRAARPQVRDIYDDAKAATGNINAVIGPNMAGVPASLQAAVTQEQTGFGNRLEESRASALTDLQSRGVAAREGKGAAIRAARDELGGSLEQILRRRLDLAGEQGAYTALRSGELRDEAQKRADQFAMQSNSLGQSERNSLRSSGIDPDTGKPIPGGRLDPKGPDGKKRPRATLERISDAQDATQLAISEIRTLSKIPGITRAEMAELLKTGADEQSIALHDPKTGKPLYNKDGTPKTRNVPGVPKISSQLLLSAALDHVLDGYVSQTNVKRLHNRGIWAKDLDLLTKRQWRKRANDPWGSGHTHT